MNWRIIFRSLKNKDMQKRLAIVVGIIVVYRMLAHIPVPLANPTQMKTALAAALGQTDLGLGRRASELFTRTGWTQPIYYRQHHHPAAHQGHSKA